MAIVLYLLFLHLLEVTVWAIFYTLRECLPDFQTSVYFSLITYATVGYGDVVLPQKWRLLGGVEGLAGVLMLSWSTAILIANVDWIQSILHHRWETRRVGRGDE
jgi:hypothetical protein